MKPQLRDFRAFAQMYLNTAPRHRSDTNNGTAVWNLVKGTTQTECKPTGVRKVSCACATGCSEQAGSETSASYPGLYMQYNDRRSGYITEVNTRE